MPQGMLRKPMAAAMGSPGVEEMQPESSPAAMGEQMADVPGDMENVSAVEQSDYNRGMAALMHIIHKQEKSQKQVLSTLEADNPVGSVGRAAATLIIGIDDRLDLMDAVILPMVEEAVPFVAELGEAAKVFKIRPGQIEQAIATATEMLIDHYGFDDEQYSGVISGMGPQDLQNMQTVYQGALTDG